MLTRQQSNERKVCPTEIKTHGTCRQFSNPTTTKDIDCMTPVHIQKTKSV